MGSGREGNLLDLNVRTKIKVKGVLHCSTAQTWALKWNRVAYLVVYLAPANEFKFIFVRKKHIMAKKTSRARSSPRHTREPIRSLGLARRGRLIFLGALKSASWVLGTDVSMKKGPSARGIQTAPHSMTGTRAIPGPCAHRGSSAAR